MPILTVGPNSTFPSIADAMAAAGPNDTIQLEGGYSNETATVTHSGMIVAGEANSTGIVLRLATGIAVVTLAGNAPIDLFDAADGNAITGNDGDNVVRVSAGSDAVSGGGGHDRLVVDYRLATGAVTGDSASNFTEAGGGARMVTVNGGFEDFTIVTGSGADTITTGDGDDIIRTHGGAGTITAGQGANYIVGGDGADTITASDGGNFVRGGDGENTITTGGGSDEIVTGADADTVVSGGGADRITVVGGADSVDAGAGDDRLVLDYSAAITSVSGGVESGNAATGYTGHIADLAGATLDFVGVESFRIMTGAGDDSIRTGAGADLFYGGDGNDRFETGQNDDRAYGEAGDDWVAASGGDDLLDGGAGRDLLYGEGGLDLLVGGGGDDRLAGGSDADKLLGGNGNDTIIGGTGRDGINGGTGSDQFVFAAGDTGTTALTADRIVDFSHADGDKIHLGQIDADTRTAADDAFTFIGTGAFAGNGAAGQLRYDVIGGNRFIEGDVDGDGAADFSIRLDGAQHLVSTDFIL
ncbi:MAG TPA: calcium-binding protein [Allosphingosinicella sp.]|jgi:Ca2+-binding RTX toxin-like protein